jgi:hypothetical protein
MKHWQQAFQSHAHLVFYLSKSHSLPPGRLISTTSEARNILHPESKKRPPVKRRPSDFYAEITSIGTDRRYPATGALFQIGRPALPALIKVIETHESSSLESENAIYTVEGIFREALAEGTKYLREAAVRALSPERLNGF